MRVRCWYSHSAEGMYVSVKNPSFLVRWPALVLAFGVLLSTGSALGGVEDDFIKLEAELAEAHRAYINAINEKQLADPDFDRTDKDQLPPDNRESLLKKMDVLVKANLEHEDAFEMALAALQWSIDIESDGAPDRLLMMARHFPDRPELTDIMMQLEMYYVYAGKVEDWLAAARTMATKSSSEKVTNAARMMLATIQKNQGEMDEAKMTLSAVIQDTPDSLTGERAKTLLYEIEHLQIGMTVPDFEATQLDGKKISIKSLRGKAVLIDFWATWCPKCIQEFPRLKRASSRFGDKLVILGVSLDESKEAIKPLIAALDPPGIQTWDRQGESYPLGELFNIQGLPTWYLIAPDGTIHARDPFGDELIPAVESALKKGASASATKDGE